MMEKSKIQNSEARIGAAQRAPVKRPQKAATKAKQPGISQSKVFRNAIKRDSVEEKTGKSMLEAMGELAGCIKNGPPDLARRHKYYYRQAMLKKYGKTIIEADGF